MKQKIYTVDTETMSILKKCTIDNHTVRIPEELPRTLYKKVNHVLIALGAKWDQRANGHIFDYDIQTELEKVIRTGTYSNWQKDTDYYATTEAVFEYFDHFIPYGHNEEINILEPSAGDGKLLEYLAAEFPKSHLYAVEINPRHIPRLKNKDFEVNVVHGDFLEYDPDIKFDLIVMNPPFSDFTNHVIHAYALLRPGGTLVSVGPYGVTFRKDGMFREWAQFVDEKFSSMIELPKAVFHGSGTDVSAVMVSLTKLDTTSPHVRFYPKGHFSAACVEIENIPDEYYGVTTVVVDVDSFLNGRNVFPCASGNDVYLTPEMRALIDQEIHKNTEQIPDAA